MNNIFTNIAAKATRLSDLMVGRDKITTEELIANYPDGFTINEFDVITVDADTFPVFTIKEDKYKFAFGGAVLSNIIDEWVKQFDGSISDTSEALKQAGGVRIKFIKSRTKSGNQVTLVEVMDS